MVNYGGVARICFDGGTNYMKIICLGKMSRSNTVTKVHVAATELQQLLKQNTNVFGEATAQKPLSGFVQL